MKLPKQVAPVERSLTTAAISGQNGVEASGILSFLHEVPWKHLAGVGLEKLGTMLK